MEYGYKPPQKSIWQGREDPNEKRIHQVIDLKELDAMTAPGICLIGFQSDIGCTNNQGRAGAFDGPIAFRKAFGKLLWKREDLKIYDAGNIEVNDLEKGQEALGKLIKKALLKNLFPLVVGGGHELVWGIYQGLDPSFAFINIDAHFDVRKGSLSSGTSYRQIYEDRLSKKQTFDCTAIGIQPLVNTFEGIPPIKTILADDLEKAEIPLPLSPLYCSLDMDVFQAAFAPGVSAPNPLGIAPEKIKPFLKKLAQSKKLKVFDVAELSPPYDRDNQTAALAAHLTSFLLHHLE